MSGRLRRALCAAAAALTLGTALGSCGGGERAPAELKLVAAAGSTRLDPALAADAGAREALWLVYTPLLTYRHADGQAGSEVIPGLAADLPEISDDGRTYVLRLRDRLQYSDGTPVRAGDFESTVERVLELDSPGARLYEGIIGARAYARGRAREIAGIDADEDTRSITIRLRAADATFANALASTYAGLVPRSTPPRGLESDPPPGVGPYRFADVRPGRGFVLERASAFADLDLPDIPTGDFRRIAVKVVPNSPKRTAAVRAGDADGVLGPAQAVPGSAGDRKVDHAGISTAYVFLNRRLAPFDDPLVREAVGGAIDRDRLARLTGDLTPGCALIPPALPAYDEGLDTVHCPYGNWQRRPDLDAARTLIDRAGAAGAVVEVVTPLRGHLRAPAIAYARILREIGLDARPKLVAPGRDRAAIGNTRSRVQTGLVEVRAPEPHPLALFAAAARATPAGFADAHVRHELRRLRTAPEPDPFADQWTALDGYVSSPPRSYVAVIGHRNAATVTSDRIDPRSAVNVPAFGDDYSRWRLRP